MSTRVEISEEELGGSAASVDEQGVDLTLIRRSLEMTPLERLKVVESWARAILRAKIVRE